MTGWWSEMVGSQPDWEVAVLRVGGSRGLSPPYLLLLRLIKSKTKINSKDVSVC